MKNLTCVWRNIYNTARAMHSRYYKHFAKHACDFSLILLEPCNFLYLSYEYKDLFMDMDVRKNHSELAIANRHQER